MLNVEKFISGLHDYIGRSLSPLLKRIEALEQRAPVPGPRGERGEKGEKGDAGLRGDVGPKGDAGERGPIGEKGDSGAPGERGGSGPAGPAGERGEPGERGERGEKGEKGDKGAPGEPGPLGPQGPRGDIGPPGEKGVAGEKGEPGRDGKDGAPGPRGEKGEKGDAGADGKSVTVDDLMPMFEAAFAKWALEVERRAMDLFQRTAAAMPVPKDGRDALNLEDLSVEHDGDGNVTFRFVRGELTKEFSLRFPRFKDKGVYREGEQYREGDGVTYGGSFWIAQKDNPEGKPDSGNGDFRLAVKKGRDGKDGDSPAKAASGPVRLK